MIIILIISISLQALSLQEVYENSDSFDDIWETILPESIYYGLMEKADNIFVIPAQFEWNDLGSWDAIYEIFSKKENDNVIRGLGTVLEGKNNIIQSNEKFTAVIGLDNIVVVNTNDATLVVPRDTKSDQATTLKIVDELYSEGTKIFIGPVFNKNLKELDKFQDATFLSFTNSIPFSPHLSLSSGPF